MNDVAKGAMQGVIASMAMTGMRQFTTAVGLVKEAPPQQVARKKKGRESRATVELFHWGFGAVGAMVYGALPDPVRQKPWTGPAYGMLVWTGFELAAPVLGLPHGKNPRVLERIATAADHALYGYVLSETKRVPSY